MTGNWSLMVTIVAALAIVHSNARAQDWDGLASQQSIPDPHASLEQGWNSIQKKLSSWRHLYVREAKIRQQLAQGHARRPKKNNRLGR